MRIPPFKLERYFAKYEFNAPYVLCASDCESLSINDLLGLEPAAADQFGQQWLGYTESTGNPVLRQAISRLYSSIESEETLVFSGAEEAIFVFLNAALQPGDHVIVHAPGYQSLYELARSAGCDVSLWKTSDANGWKLDLNWLSANIRRNTRAIIINCPHNPTGYLMGAEKQRAIIEMARNHGLLLFSDEVYRGLEHDPADRLPAACDLYENAISLGVMSKTYGLPGLRIGWIATHNADLLAQLASLKDYTTICNSAPGEFLSTLALNHHEALAARNLNIILDNLRLLDEFFGTWQGLFGWQQPKAGSVAFPRFLGAEGAEAFCAALVERQGVLLVPSGYFDFGDQHFRVGYGRKNLPQALEKLEAYCIASKRKSR